VQGLQAHLVDAYLVQAVDIDTRSGRRSERQRQVNPRKVYPIDTGLAQAFRTSPDADRGRPLETLVCLEDERIDSDEGTVRVEPAWRWLLRR
jgi:predicted AAA+ superfamily ATPase